MEEFNILTDVYLPLKEKKDKLNSPAYQVAKENNIDTALLDGRDLDPFSTEIIPSQEVTEDTKQFTNGFLEFLSNVPQDMILSFVEGAANGAEFFGKLAPLAHKVAGDPLQVAENTDNIVDSISAFRDKVKNAKSGNFYSELVGMVAQELPYSVPLYKTFTAMGMPKARAVILSGAIGGALSFTKEDSFLMDSDLANTVKTYMNAEPGSPEEAIIDKLGQSAEYSVYGYMFPQIIKGLKKAKNFISVPQGSFVAGGTAASVEGVNKLNQALDGNIQTEAQPTNIIEPKGEVMLNSMFPKLSKELAPTFFSKLRQTVDNLKMNKGNADQIKNMISNTPGVKKSEMKWSDLDYFLDQKKINNEKVTKEEIQGFLNENAVQIREVNYTSKYDKVLDEIGGDIETDNIDDILKKYNVPDNLRYDFIEAAEIKYEINNLENLTGYEFEDYISVFTRPDKKINVSLANVSDDIKRELGLYRDNTNYPYEVGNVEKILGDLKFKVFYDPTKKTLGFEKTPNSLPVKNFDYENLNKANAFLEYQDLNRRFSDLPEEVKPAIYPTMTLPGGENYRMKAFALPSEKIPVTTTTDFGNTLKRVEKGKIDYFGGHTGLPGEFAHVRYKDRMIENKKTLFVEEMQSDLGIKMDKATKNQLKDNQSYDFPFKNNWYEVVFKRLIREAAEEGYDQVAIPSGAVAARRYKMAEDIIGLTITRKTPTNQQTKNEIRINIVRDGNEYQEKVSLEELQKLTPKFYDDAKRYLEENVLPEKNKYRDITANNNYLNLEFDLSDQIERIPGGKDQLYDKAFPSFLEKYGKKWGAKVRTISSTDDKVARPYNLELFKNVQGKFNDRPFNIYVLDITPSMKQEALDKGQPLFEILGPILAGGAATKEVLDNQR